MNHYDLGRKADHTIKLLADPVSHLSRPKTETTSMNWQAGLEMMQINACMSSKGLQGFDSPEAVLRKPPAVTSTVIEQVKALSEKDFTLLIIPEAELETLPSGASTRIFIAYTVDLQKFHCGSKKKVFTQL
jgi:hypothetical protein